MLYIVAAVIVGVVVGLVRRGSLRALAYADLRWTSLLVAGAGLQVVAFAFDGPAGVAGLLLSFAFLLAFTLANLARAGMGVVFVGVAMNALVIAANGGMPVRESAIVRAGLSEPGGVDELDFGGKWHLERPDDRFTILGDIIPVPGAREVLSFGDLAMAVGVADVIVHLMRKKAPVNPPEPAMPASTSSG